MESTKSTQDGCDKAPLFSPPLWIQRRALVSRILKEHNVHSVLDLGCGEGSLLQILLNDVSFSKLAGVDIDVASLHDAKDGCSPTEYDRQHLRELPVQLDLYEGSVAQVDKRLLGFEGITSVEVIEHLDPPVLEAFPATTLGAYRPRVMVVTTPNGDFNVNFPDLGWGTADAKFRHWDHRFEWTRTQFKDWGRTVADKYGYNVRFEGVGLLASRPDDVSVGHCTQVAIFTREDLHTEEHRETQSAAVEGLYKHLAKIEYPYFSETGFTDEEIVMELKDKTPAMVQIEWYTENLDAKQLKLPDVPWPTKDKMILPIDRYWRNLRVRQLCKSLNRLEEVFASPAAAHFFTLDADKQKIKILFDVAQEVEPEINGWEGNDNGEWDSRRPSSDDENKEEDSDDSWGGGTGDGATQERGCPPQTFEPWEGPKAEWDDVTEKVGYAWGSPPPLKRQRTAEEPASLHESS